MNPSLKSTLHRELTPDTYELVVKEIERMEDELAEEIIQIAAMCLRYVETGDRYRQKGK